MRVKPYVPWLYLAPALLFVGVYLVWPTVQTIGLSFLGPHGERFVGLDNFVELLTQNEIWIAARNNIVWMLTLPALAVTLGTAFALLFERVRYETLAKSSVFLPMVISFVGAGVIWKFVYAYMPEIYPQIGILNAIRAALGMDPLAWMMQRPVLNNLLLVVVAAWGWTGFCLIVISAAYKSMNREMVDAARLDGATEWQVIRYVVLPQIKSTLVAVTTLLMVISLKTFDVVYVMTGGNSGTDVLAHRLYREMFRFHDSGIASALAVLLLVAVLPLVGLILRRSWRERRAT